MTGDDLQEPEFRDQTQYVATSTLKKLWKRSIGLAHGKTQADLFAEAAYEGKSTFSLAKDYLKIQIFQWVWHYLRSRFGPKWPFADYGALGDDNGIYKLAASTGDADPAEPVQISLAGDWGSGTEDAFNVGQSVNLGFPHFTIHLGDIYYVSTKKEVQENMLGGRVQWPRGYRGSFALNANHEMYSQGKGYFTHLLPALGLKGDHGQKASFFCLKNDHWLVIGLDTGYYSVGVPILEMIFRPSSKLHEKLMEWLQNEVRLQEDHQRGVILLSHHQYYSQFESAYDRPAQQLAQLLQRPALWFWGHEHRFALYGKHATEKGTLQVYGRCLGHGGLPIEDIKDQPRKGQKYQNGLVLYDKRERCRIGPLEIPVGFNGYANLTFDGKRLAVEYRDTRQPLVTEKWEVGPGGVLKGIAIDQHVVDDDLVLHEGASLGDAIA